ncbi:MAG: hypothetical protein ABI740_07565, partial [Alphaproteobacteria bacterium]
DAGFLLDWPVFWNDALRSMEPLVPLRVCADGPPALERNMSSVKSIALGLLISGFVMAGCAHSPMAKASSTAKADNGVLKACLFKSTDQMMKSPECTAQLSKTNITADDVAAIKSCKAMSTSAMNADATCKAQMARHAGAF